MNGSGADDLPRLDGIHLLVVEDDADTRAFLEVLLSLTGARVTWAETTAGALATFAADRPDLVLSDIGLPDEDGYCLIRKVRAAGAAVPAIALTAFASQSDVARSLEAGYQGVVGKPIDEPQLFRAIASLVDGKGRQPPP